jgi:DNA-binding NarL/FixJ family response regulator
MTILILHRYSLIRQGLRLTAEALFPDSQIYDVDEILRKSDFDHNLKPDLIILGIAPFEQAEGLRVIQTLQIYYPTAKIVVFDNIVNKESLTSYFKNGISGYLSTNSSTDEFSTCMGTVQSGNKYIDSNSLIDIATNQFVKERVLKTNTQERKKTLTANEEMIALHMASGLKMSEISRKLNRKISTISTIKSNIFRKLNVNNVIALAAVLKQQKEN